MFQFVSAVALVTLSATSTLAKCETGQRQFMRCSFDNGNAVQVCMSDDIATYRYGPLEGTPELALSLPFGEGATAIPWPGVGSAIWEAVEFRNSDVVYEVYGGFERMFDDDIDTEMPPPFGGIVISREGEGILARLTCSVGTVEYAF